LIRAEHEQHAVVVADRIVQIVGEQGARLEPNPELHRERRILDPAGDHVRVILLGRHPGLRLAVAANHAGRHLAVETQAPDRFLPRRVERGGDAAAAVRRIDADIGAVQPVAVGFVRCEPSALDDVGEGVVDVMEIKFQTERGGRAHDRVAIERDELSVGKQLDVFPIVRRLEPLRVGERRKADPLQLLELLRMLGSRLHHHDPARKPSVVPHHRGPTVVYELCNVVNDGRCTLVSPCHEYPAKMSRPVRTLSEFCGGCDRGVSFSQAAACGTRRLKEHRRSSAA